MGFYVVRLLIAFTGGVLVEVYRVNNLPAALQIGASTPAVLAALVTFRRPQPYDPMATNKSRHGGPKDTLPK